jgi:N-acetylmuramoyl-L-alanine amidase
VKIFIDPGHGGNDPGAVGNDLKEKDVTLDISLRQKALFEKLGHVVKMSRTSDTTVSLSTRVSQANQWGADVFISNHINAGGGIGEEVWCSIYGGTGRKYATRAEKNLSEIFKSRGVKTKQGSNGDYFYVIKATSMPAILVEFAFIDNVSDAAKLKDSNILQKSAEAVVYGVLDLQ